MDKFDLIVIGGGPGGYVAAERAGEAGKKVALFEKRALGGVCLNEGCIPTKTFLNSSKVYSYALHGDHYGVSAQNVTIDHARVLERKKKVVNTLVSGVAAKMKANKVIVIPKEAVITGKTADGFTVEADGVTYAASRLVIATGSQSSVPPVPGLEEGLESGFVMTSREILEIDKLPASLVVIGGGVIGLEMACYFATVGVKVTVIEMLDKIAGATDKDISNTLMKLYKKEGMDFRLSCKVTSVGKDSVTFEENGESKTIKADAVLLSVGRRPNTRGIGLESIGVYTERGAIVTDEYLRTNVAGVYAIGDVNGKYMLAHTAYREAEVAVNHILGKKDRMRYEAIPSVIYTHPEIAWAGKTEEQLKADGIAYEKALFPWAASGRAIANGAEDGFTKLLFDQASQRLLGGGIVGMGAGDLIGEVCLAVEMGCDAVDMGKTIHPHPTLCESVGLAAEAAHGSCTDLPPARKK
jgi:dihydrolipoamide dehydrogenase